MSGALCTVCLGRGWQPCTACNRGWEFAVNRRHKPPCANDRCCDGRIECPACDGSGVADTEGGMPI